MAQTVQVIQVVAPEENQIAWAGVLLADLAGLSAVLQGTKALDLQVLGEGGQVLAGDDFAGLEDLESDLEVMEEVSEWLTQEVQGLLVTVDQQEEAAEVETALQLPEDQLEDVPVEFVDEGSHLGVGNGSLLVHLDQLHDQESPVFILGRVGAVTHGLTHQLTQQL